jgi:antitoxin ParD1/3/4
LQVASVWSKPTTLKSKQEQFILKQLTQGQFESANEVITKALQLLEYQDWQKDLQRKVNEAAQELERGEGMPLAVVVDQIQDKFSEAHEPY